MKKKTMEKEIIKLTEAHRGVGSQTFTGRPQGEQVRKVLGLGSKDSDGKQYLVTIPTETASLNASFYLGLFFESIYHLKGMTNFKKKYEISILEEDKEIKEGLEEDIEDCERQALNEYLGDTGLDFDF